MTRKRSNHQPGGRDDEAFRAYVMRALEELLKQSSQSEHHWKEQKQCWEQQERRWEQEEQRWEEEKQRWREERAERAQESNAFQEFSDPFIICVHPTLGIAYVPMNGGGNRSLRYWRWRVTFCVMDVYLFYYTGRLVIGHALPLMERDWAIRTSSA